MPQPLATTSGGTKGGGNEEALVPPQKEKMAKINHFRIFAPSDVRIFPPRCPSQ